jgi:hypothetical protein
MWKNLLELYQESRLNVGEPECLFAETQVFNEGWLLRSVLKKWKTSSKRSRFPFFRFPPGAKVYSEGQLRTPFKVRRKGERTGKPKGESNTHVDGIAGDFSIADGTKSGIELDPGCPYIAVFEAKLYSRIGKAIKNARDYDQISRTTACLIHALLAAEPRDDFQAHIVVLYPADRPYIDPDLYEDNHVKDEIAGRLNGYKEAGKPTEEIRLFEAGWEEMLEGIRRHFITWEEALDEIGDKELMRFYELCKEFNRR